MLAEIRESVAQLDRGEFVTKEQLRDRIEARREASLGRQAA
jgi:predicted transcriptional regulator